MKALRLVQPRLLQGLLEAPEAPGWECFKALMQELRYVEICWNLLKSYMLKYVEIISCKLKVLSATCSEARRDFYTWWRNWNIQPFTWLWQHEVAPSLDGLPWRVSCRPQGQIWCRGHVKLVELNSFRAKLRENALPCCAELLEIAVTEVAPLPGGRFLGAGCLWDGDRRNGHQEGATWLQGHVLRWLVTCWKLMEFNEHNVCIFRFWYIHDT